MADARRGFWVRLTAGKLEVCAGREGDDVYVSVPVDGKQLAGLQEAVRALEWALEMAAP